MSKLFYAIFTLFAVAAVLLGYRVTSALFSDSAASADNTFTAAEVFPHLVINEVLSDGNVTLEWVEIFNPTASSVDVSGWIIEDGVSSDIFPTVSPIPAGGYAVVKGNTNSVSIPVSAINITLSNSNIGSGLNDSGDVIRLRTPLSIIVDEMNYGDTSSPFPTPPDEPNSAETLKRNPNGTDTDSASDWVTTSGNSIGASN